MSMSFKFKKVLKQRQELLDKYPNVTREITIKPVGRIDLSWFIPKDIDTKVIDCRPYFRDAVLAARVLFPFEETKHVYVPSRTYNVAKPVVLFNSNTMIKGNGGL